MTDTYSSFRGNCQTIGPPPQPYHLNKHTKKGNPPSSHPHNHGATSPSNVAFLDRPTSPPGSNVALDRATTAASQECRLPGPLDGATSAADSTVAFLVGTLVTLRHAVDVGGCSSVTSSLPTCRQLPLPPLTSCQNCEQQLKYLAPRVKLSLKLGWIQMTLFLAGYSNITL
jgi:hypothetical protein